MDHSTPPRRSAGLRAGAVGLGLVVFAGLSGAFAGCSRDADDARLVLALAPDPSCAAAPVACVNELQVTLTGEDGEVRGAWTLPFDVADGTASLGDVPESGRGRFTALGRAALPAIEPVILFSGTSDVVKLSGGSQRVEVPVSCPLVPDPCETVPTPTPNPLARFPSGSPANAVVGQADFLTCAENAVQPQNGSVREPDGLFLTQTRLWVADRNLGRIAVFSREDVDGPRPVPLDGFVLGHNGLNEGQQGDTNDDFDRPRGVVLDTAANRVYVADTENHRGPIYEPIPSDATDPPFDLVIGQDSTSDSNRNDGGPDAQSLNEPWSVLRVSSPDGVFVSDSGNHRVLFFPGPITANKPTATGLCGQATVNAIQPNRGAGVPARNSMSGPAHLATDGTRLYLADRGNNRVLVWNTLADAAAGLDPAFVLGQPDFTSNAPNRGGTPGPETLSGPRGVAASPTRLVVADSDNHRVLIWQPPPTADGQPATEVLGKADFTTVTPNAGSATGGACAGTNTCPGVSPRPEDDTMFRPGAVLLDGDHLWVSDTCNHRVLRFTAVP